MLPLPLPYKNPCHYWPTRVCHHTLTKDWLPSVLTNSTFRACPSSTPWFPGLSPLDPALHPHLYIIASRANSFLASRPSVAHYSFKKRKILHWGSHSHCEPQVASQDRVSMGVSIYGSAHGQHWMIWHARWCSVHVVQPRSGIFGWNICPSMPTGHF